MAIRIKFTIVLITLCFQNTHAQEIPDWVKNRPVSNTYYIGIGIVSKNQNNQNIYELARNEALKDMSSEISSYLESIINWEVVEEAGIISNDYKRNLNITTHNYLEDYELVDTWEDENELWVYYRLSKNLFLDKRKKRIEKARDLSFGLYKKAKEKEDKRNISESISLYLQALNSLQDFIVESVKVDFNGYVINLESELYSSLQNMLKNIYIKPDKLTYYAKIGRSVSEPVSFYIYFNNPVNEKVPLKNLPVNFSFERGSGQLINKNTTNEFGTVGCNITKITGKTETHIIRCELDIDMYKSSDLFVIQNSLINELNIPYADCNIEVSNLKIIAEFNELHFGNKKDINYLEPAVKNFLAKNNISFTSQSSDADYLLKLDVNSRQGPESYNIYIAYADLSIHLIDLSDQNEIYSTIKKNITGKEIDNYEKADLAAYNNAFKEIDNILPELIKILQD